MNFSEQDLQDIYELLASEEMTFRGWFNRDDYHKGKDVEAETKYLRTLDLIRKVWKQLDIKPSLHFIEEREFYLVNKKIGNPDTILDYVKQRMFN